MKLTRKIKYNEDGEPYFKIYGGQHFLMDINRISGLDETCFTNNGYYGGFQLIDIDFGIEDHVIIKTI